MATRTTLSAFRAMVDSILQGIDLTTLAAADRDRTVYEAVDRYDSDVPRRRAVEFAGDGGGYYLLHGLVLDSNADARDAAITILSAAGPDTALAVKFTLTRRQTVRELRFLLERTGATVAGDALARLYTDASGVPGSLVAESLVVDIDDGDAGVPLGRFDFVPFAIDDAPELPAGVYHASIHLVGYTYNAGSSEVALGVVQGGGPVNTVSTLNSSGPTWSAYGTPSDGLVQVVASMPGWESLLGTPATVEYPAADIDADEQPTRLADDEFEVYLTAEGSFLRFPSHRPSASESVRMTVADPYTWRTGPQPSVDVPGEHVKAICYLAAAKGCYRLAAKFGQKRSSTLSADVADRSQQGEFYRSLAKDFEKEYARLLGLDKDAERKPGMTLTAMTPSQPASGYMFHGRSRGQP